MWKKLVLFWSSDLWNFRLDELTGWKRLWYKTLRLISLSVSGFCKDDCSIRASSLTYYTLMSIVPILALSFSIAKAFNLHEPLKEELLVKFHENKEAITEMIFFADRLVNETRGGLLAGIGIIVLIWSALSLIESMESAVNHIWDMNKMRSWRRLISEYISLLLVAPILFIFSSTTVVIVATHIEHLFQNLPLGNFLISFLHIFATLIPYASFSLFFSFLYYVLPNVKVKFYSAFIGGVVAGIFYLLAQWGYIYFQIGVSHYGAVYGSLAALPLFLIWVQVSWFIFLFGAEVSCSYQSLDAHEFGASLEKASPRFKKILSLWLLQFIMNHFQETLQPTSLFSIRQQCRIPLSIATPLLQELVFCNLLIKAKDSTYLPSRPLENLRISDALEAIESKGESDMPFIHSKELIHFERALRSFAELIKKSPENQLLSALKPKTE